MNKKGEGVMTALILICIIGIVAVLFFAGWMYGFRIVTNVMTNLNSDNNIVNITDASQKIIVPVNNAYNILPLISFFLIIAYILGSLIMAYFVNEHPVMLVAYLLVVVCLTIFSAYISNVYDTIRTTSALSGVMNEFTMTNIIMAGLPIWVGLIGLIMLILMFIRLNHNSGGF